MGDTDSWLRGFADVPTFEVLFSEPRGRDDALEAVKQLKAGIDHLHVRKILWEAHRRWNLVRAWRDNRRQVEKLVAALHTVNTSLRPAPPHLPDLERQIVAARPRSGKRGGRPILPFYSKAIRDLRSIGVSRDLAKTMLRGFGLQYGPSPRS